VQGRFQFSEEIKDSSLKSWLCLSSPKDGWKRGMGAIGRKLPYLCSCDSGSNHAVRFLQSWKTALIARDAFPCELWWLAGRHEILCSKIQLMLARDGLAGALTVFVNVSSHDRRRGRGFGSDNQSSEKYNTTASTRMRNHSFQSCQR
jgi:hypothetical protein